MGQKHIGKIWRSPNTALLLERYLGLSKPMWVYIGTFVAIFLMSILLDLLLQYVGGYVFWDSHDILIYYP